MSAAARSALPNLIVIGAHKCGTSSLHYYLDLHPEIEMSSPKELRFFYDRPLEGTSSPVEWFQRGNWSRGVEWYRSHFSPLARVRGESSPTYTAPVFPDAAERMHSVVPDVRLIYLVRNPVDRMLSDCVFRREAGLERRSLVEAVCAPGSPYLERSRYCTRLRPFLERFGRGRILVVASEDLLRRRRQTMREVFDFLGVDAGFWSPRMERLRNRSRNRGLVRRLMGELPKSRAGARLVRSIPQEPKWWLERLASKSRIGGSGHDPLPAAARARLNDQLREEVEALRELSGRFDSWEL
jgi:Sulfotransferase family